MIVIPKGLPSYKTAGLQNSSCENAQEALGLLHYHMTPMSKSNNEPDARIYKEFRESIGFLADVLKIEREKVYAPRDKHIWNWDFLQIASYCWKDAKIEGIGADEHCILRERRNIENLAVRTLAKFDVIQLNLFRGQTCFSIYGWNPEKLRVSMQEILQSYNRFTVPEKKVRKKFRVN